MKTTKKLAALVLFLACAWQPAFGLEFEQKTAAKYPTAQEVKSIAVCGNGVFAGTGEGVLVLAGDRFVDYARTPELKGVRSLLCDGTDLLIGAKAGLYVISMTSSLPARRIYEGEVNYSFVWRNALYIGTPGGFMRLGSGAPEPVEIGTLVQKSTPMKESWVKTCPYKINTAIRGVAGEGDKYLYLATPAGLIRLVDDEWCAEITGRQGLPYEDVLSVAVKDGVLWAGTSFGAARYDGKQWEYFQGAQYLLSERVSAIAADAPGSAWLATPKGVTHIEYKPMTLSEKAAYFEKATRERHLRYDLVSDSHLDKPGDLSTNRPFTNDNDGLWTAMYIAAECYRYAATKDPEARKYASDSLKAMIFLETVTEIPGLMARSIARPGEQVDNVKGDHPMQWDNWTADKQWRWKGDTSSDEVVGHYYAYAIYYDLVADEKEKDEIRAKIRRITDYIIENDYNLLDVDGKPTTYGKWNFYDNWRRFSPDRGLNSLEILSHLKVAYHITGDRKYQEACLDLALKKGYAKFTVNQKINIPGFINHSDDELAFLSYYPLLKYEDDPELLNYYRESIERSWRIEKPERSPLFNFIYASASPKAADFDLEGALFTLERISLDLVRWNHLNSRRADVQFKSAKGRFRERESKTPLPPDERTVMKWNGNPYQLDTGVGWQPTELMDTGIAGGGASEEAGTFWLLSYWMGRYYGYLAKD